MQNQLARTKAARIPQRLKALAKKAGATAVMFALPIAAFAQDTTEGDVTASTAKIALWLAGAITLSAAMTAAVISIRASKLPRKGA